jgi:hypothetical protein
MGRHRGCRQVSKDANRSTSEPSPAPPGSALASSTPTMTSIQHRIEKLRAQHLGESIVTGNALPPALDSRTSSCPRDLIASRSSADSGLWSPSSVAPNSPRRCRADRAAVTHSWGVRMLASCVP